jgi:hypothetical protein
MYFALAGGGCGRRWDGSFESSQSSSPSIRAYYFHARTPFHYAMLTSSGPVTQGVADFGGVISTQTKVDRSDQVDCARVRLLVIVHAFSIPCRAVRRREVWGLAEASILPSWLPAGPDDRPRVNPRAARGSRVILSSGTSRPEVDTRRATCRGCAPELGSRTQLLTGPIDL